MTGWTASSVLHALVFGSLFAFSLRSDDVSPIRFAAQPPAAISLTMNSSLARELPTDLDAIKIEVEPGRVRMADRRFTNEVTDSDAESLDEVDGELPKPIARRTTTDSPPVAEAPVFPRQFVNTPPAVDVATLTSVTTTLPEFKENRPPVYPRVAINNRWQGTVLLRLHINAAGEITEVEVLTSSGHQVLDGAAVNAVKSWRCKPATRNGKVISTKIRLPLKFNLP